MCAVQWCDWNNLPAEMPAPKVAGDGGPDSLQNWLLTLRSTTVLIVCRGAGGAEEGSS